MKPLEQLGVSPAPWYIEKETGVLCAQSEYYKHPIVDDCGNFDNENDKRLIAASPEMYEALRLCMHKLCLACRNSARPCVTMCETMCVALEAMEKAGGKE